MGSFFLWVLLVTLVGWVAAPLAASWLRFLPGRGLGMARALGLLLWGYLFWLLVSLKIASNDAGGQIMALAIVAGASAWTIRKQGWKNLLDCLKQERAMLVTGEVLFVAAFGFWALMRAANPEISGTEKPMEMAFINAILRSPTFPPHDPWLSGYAISYYYFGYVMVAMITRLAGTDPAVAFNLAGSLWFSLTALGAYSTLYSLLQAWHEQRKGRRFNTAPVFSLLAPLYVLFVSNFEGLLEMLHARGIFWQQMDGTWQSRFWKWIDIQELVNPPALPLRWEPTRVSGFWWWRASRVLQDYDLQGNSREIIDEFPAFSYYLADLHPHVLAMPFVLLAIGLALNFYLKFLQADDGRESGYSLGGWLVEWLRGAALQLRDLQMTGWLQRKEFWFAALLLGALSFLNTWDFPMYVALVCAAYALARFQSQGWSVRRIWDFIELGLLLGVCGIVLYLPFYLGFSSQAGGILPSLSFFTRGIHLWVMFGTLLLPIIAWLAWLWAGHGERADALAGIKISSALLGGLWLLSYLYGAAISLGAAVGGGNAGFAEAWGLFAGLHGTADAGILLLGSLARRLAQPGAWITLLGLLVIVWSLLAAFRKKPKPETDQQLAVHSIHGFALLLVLMGAGLVLAPEFFYLRDQFGWRMNTIFKFYFQVWMVWSLAAAFASVVLIVELKKTLAWVTFFVIWVVVIMAALIYPLYGVYSRFKNVQPEFLTLDGMIIQSPEEQEAIRWLQQAPLGVVAEAIGGSYSGYGRASTFSGQPTVLGWPGHESQWRGGDKEMGSREQDIQTLYRTSDWKQAEEIIQRYRIRYIYLGSLEQSTYRASEDKFRNHLTPVFQNNGVVIYATGLEEDPPLKPIGKTIQEEAQ